MKVDPRACGVNQMFELVLFHHSGRSPRMRGKHIVLGVDELLVGSIPAHAG